MCARKINDIKPVIQSSRVCTRRVHDGFQMHAYMSGMQCQIWITCMQILSQGQQNTPYEHVHDSFRDIKCKSC